MPEQLPGWVVPATVAFAYSFTLLRSWLRKWDERRTPPPEPKVVWKTRVVYQPSPETEHELRKLRRDRERLLRGLEALQKAEQQRSER